MISALKCSSMNRKKNETSLLNKVYWSSLDFLCVDQLSDTTFKNRLLLTISIKTNVPPYYLKLTCKVLPKYSSLEQPT